MQSIFPKLTLAQVVLLQELLMKEHIHQTQDWDTVMGEKKPDKRRIALIERTARSLNFLEETLEEAASKKKR